MGFINIYKPTFPSLGGTILQVFFAKSDVKKSAVPSAGGSPAADGGGGSEPRDAL